MATQKEKVQQVIDVLKDANKQIGELLKDSPDLNIHSNGVLRRLRNGFAHAAGLPIDIDEIEEVKAPHVPLTHIAGVPIQQREVIKPETSIPSSKEEDELNEFVELAYEDFGNDEDPESLLASYNELIIRGVAVKAGMEVTPTDPAEVDVEFVTKVQLFIKEKQNS